MSVYKNNETAFYSIEGNPIIGRYIDIRKFISMLFKNSLFFVRVSKLEDPYEGMYPRRTREERINWMKRFVREENVEKINDTQIEKTVIDREKLDMLLRDLTCVNSWHMFENENYLLWKTYSNTDAGIMILSSYEKLFAELENSIDKKFIISKISYADYDNDYYGSGSTNLAFIHKPHFYSDEKEIRAIHEVSNTGWIHHWKNEENENGIYVQVNLQNLIDKIIVAPFAPQWYFDLIKSINEKYSLNKPIIYSKLRRTI